MPPGDALGLTEQECRRYHKLARFVQHLELSGRGGSPEDVIEAIELFPKEVGRYLKVAGGDKAVVLWEALRRRGNATHEVLVEFGTLVGYTAIRFGIMCSRRRQEEAAPATGTGVVTVELDLCHACIARHAIDLSGLSGVVEVWVGHVRDVIPRLSEEFGGLSLGFLFMDQKSTAFHEDLQQLELMDVIGVGAHVIAGNCLKPGAPFYVWQVTQSSTYSTTIWTLPEFAQDEVEDWLVSSCYAAKPSGLPTPCAPRTREQLSLLAWETENVRTGGERSLHVDDWVAFSQYVRRCFKALGIEATMWSGLEYESVEGAPMSSAQLSAKYAAMQVAVDAALAAADDDD